MQGVDLAIVELQPTLETLIDDGIQPLALAIELQLAGPTPEPQVIIGKNRFGALSVSWSYEHRLIDHYTVKMGPPDTTAVEDLHLRP
ncbi:Trypsin domain protein [Pseudomonas amygdali pv. mori]|nr:Trypsin domain protein [Pseudomonas amygdali pv. mori]KWT10962.1 hypothetical protein AL047_13820 [Pseudomonas syringae pv. broussonetiae]RMQ34403.1 Trypsin domain protein [Pseudomonas amygdali pv. mori]RMR44551.1 Trypsin domain protein [Pseudomonas amygdali pv. mori]RMT26975.1 Trypsin domain protein [Pseudomonas amygdali pv. mori]